MQTELKNFKEKYCDKCESASLCDKGITITRTEIICIDKNIHEARENLRQE